MATKRTGSRVKKEGEQRQKRSLSLTARQRAFALAYAQTHSETKAALIAGYSAKNPGQSGHQALQALFKKMPDIMDRHGLSLEVLIEKHLIPLLNAQITKFATKAGKFTDWVDVPDNSTQLKALDIAFRLHGAYATNEEARKDANGVRVVVLDSPKTQRELIDAVECEPGRQANCVTVSRSIKRA